MHSATHDRRPHGLTRLPRDTRAGHVQAVWDRWTLAALVGTVPAFYLELLGATRSPLASALYGLAALSLLLGLWHTARRTSRGLRHHLRANLYEVLLVGGLLLAMAVPASIDSPLALSLRLAVAALALLRMMWSLQPVLTRGGLPWLLLMALVVLGLCGLGFWWLEPSAQTLGDGLWLAFTTAATVGYGDISPTTAASKIFAVFVVLLGFGVLSLVMAAIASMWVETQERRIEKEILQDLHRQLRSVRDDVAALRKQLSNADTPR